jgi:hypothetical protein
VLAYNGPGNAGVTVGVAAVKFITIIEPNRPLVAVATDGLHSRIFLAQYIRM